MKKLKKIIVVFLLVFLLTGCTKQLTVKETDKETGKTKKVAVVYKKGKNATGQTLTKNIICKPSDKELVKLYEDSNVKLDKLPDCSKFTPSFNDEGIWENLFVRPLSWIILKVGYLVKNFGWAVILVGILIRLVLYPVTKKSAMQSENLKKAQPELQKLEKKYANKTNDQQAMMQKSQEMMAIYKKYDISLFSGCLVALIQLPLFIAFLEAINRTPAIFEGKFLGLQLGTTPSFALSHGNFGYIILPILVFIVTFFSLKLNGTQATDDSNPAAGSTKMMMNVMIVMITISAFQLSTAIGLYWISSSLFTIIQNLLVKRSGNSARIK